jgi:two-component system C4-dicarboxylate transport sensor histidine kinase DctB
VAARGDGERVTVQVTDTGPGLGPEVQARMFEPFFTTKPAGEGLGLGLVISVSMLKQQGSDLAARNVPGAGAQFEFSLEQLPADAS